MRKILLTIGIVLVLVAVAMLGVGYWLLQPVVTGSPDQVAFVVPKGQAVVVTGQKLTERGLIRHPLVFRAVVWRYKLAHKLQAGTFELSPAQSPIDIAKALTEGTNDVWLTIKEGLRKEEIAELAVAELPDFDRDAFLTASAGLEGQLFPDTYLVPKQITPESLVSLLTRTFTQKVITPNQTELDESDKSVEEILILASLIEREALGKTQMQLVASILQHRLAIGMPLQVDATLQYARGFDGKTWWPTPLAADKTVVSPFNTYLNPGLPPAPICNPSAAAFAAAIKPEPTDYLFYLHAPDGKMYPAKTLEEHNANIAKYLR